MSESYNYPLLYPTGMPPSPSDTDDSDNDGTMSPTPTTPLDSDLDDELHSVIGEAIVEKHDSQLEEEEARAEEEEKAQQQAPLLTGSVPDNRQTPSDDRVISPSTEATVESTSSDLLNAVDDVPRGNAVVMDDGTASQNTRTTAPAAKPPLPRTSIHADRHPSTLDEGDDSSEVKKPHRHRKESDPFFDYMQMPPNAAPITDTQQVVDSSEGDAVATEERPVEESSAVIEEPSIAAAANEQGTAKNMVVEDAAATAAQDVVSMHPPQRGSPTHVMPVVNVPTISTPPLLDSQSGNVNAAPHPQQVQVQYAPQLPPPIPPPQAHPMGYHHHPGYPMQAFTPAMLPSASSANGGRRKIRLRLQEDVRPPMEYTRKSFFFRRTKTARDVLNSIDMEENHVDRGCITVSWFEGTTSVELQEHVRTSVIRKMGLQGTVKLADLRIIDESMDPPEEIVLSPYIPDGSEFLLRFSTKDTEQAKPSPSVLRRKQQQSNGVSAPVSPSAAPSPYPSSTNLKDLSESQLQILGAKLQLANGNTSNMGGYAVSNEMTKSADDSNKKETPRGTPVVSKTDDIAKEPSAPPEDPIESRLRQITELLLLERTGGKGEQRHEKEKRQVIFVLANYFVLFLSLIAICAEIQARAPEWMKWMETQMESVQHCATDQEALFNCVSSGDLSGLIASFALWITRSAATKRIFLFGFESPKRLWTVVYEALVTAFCWGTSYMFIRRGMNPDTKRNFLQKYWKDAVYGSLAGFNASFMKAVLKNLIPQESLANALDDRELRLRIFSWLNFH